MFPEILNFFLNISKSSKYIKTIWLHFINSTVKTPKICLSPEMKTQTEFEEMKFLYKGYNKTLNNFTLSRPNFSTSQPPRRLGSCTLIQAEFVKGR